MSNNAPYASVDLTKDQYDFLIRNCEVNMRQSLAMIDPCGPMKDTPLHMDTVQKIVDMIEQFREIKAVVEKGKL